MPRACGHNQRGFCSASWGLSSLSDSPEAEGKAQAAEHTGVFKQVPPKMFKSEGRGRCLGRCLGSARCSSAVAQSGGHRGPEAVSGRAVAIRHTNGATAHLRRALKISAG